MHDTRPNFGGYLRALLTPFFWPWWAVLTGIASIASWVGVPVGGFEVSPWLAMAVAAIASMGLFLLASTFWQCWKLYRYSLTHVVILGIERSDAHAGNHVVLLKCGAPLPDGTLLELSRTINDVEVPIGIVVVKRTNSRDTIQAHPLWIGPVHLNELMKNSLRLKSVRATTLLSLGAMNKSGLLSTQAEALTQ